jgi:hypothetical protein
VDLAETEARQPEAAEGLTLDPTVTTTATNEATRRQVSTTLNFFPSSLTFSTVKIASWAWAEFSTSDMAVCALCIFFA